MFDDDQERFEDYVELENYIEALQSGKAAHPRANLKPEQVGVYQMAALFNSATDEDAEPDPAFVERLKTQLFAMNEIPQSVQHASEPVPDEVPLHTEPVELSSPAHATTRRARFFSRRGLLTGGALAAASLVVGAGIGYEVQKSENSQIAVTGNPGTRPGHLQIAPGTPTTWHFVTTLADLGNDAVRFSSDTMVGYVIRTDNTSNTTDSVLALSGSCTHMGCLVQWKSTERHFACPCHGALFGAQGAQIPTDYKYALSPLPSLNTKIEDGKVYVEVPL